MTVSQRLASIVISLALFGVATGCDSAPGEKEIDLELAPISVLPDAVRRAPVRVRDAYRFAVANTELLRQVACYCGCGSMGHVSDAACFLRLDSTEGGPVFESHALGCSICVDVAQDFMRLMRQGNDLEQIQDYIDRTYSRYGPPNLP